MIVVGAGRVGRLFARAGVGVVRRGEPIPAEPPVVICTPADALPTVLAAVPDSVRDDCVFIQNGAWADRVGARTYTRGVLWLAAPGDGSVTTNRPSLFEGRHAARMVELCAAVGVPAAVIPPEEWAAAWGEKMLWNAIFGLLGERWNEPVGATAAREAEVHALVEELAPAFGAPLAGGAAARGALTERLLAYGRAIPSFQARVREYRIRNGWIIARARAAGLSTPLHDAALRAIGRPDTPEAIY